MKKWHIYFISWFAWAWKWTLIKWLLESNIDNLELSISYKTREARKWEILWVDYNKLTIEEFKLAIENKEFLEYNFVHNQAYYWTKYSDVIDNWINKWKIILKEMDILTLPKLLKERPDLRKHFTYIFLYIPIEIIKERMKKRWDDVEWEDFLNRIKSAKKEKELLYLADYIIDRTKSESEVLNEVKQIILWKKFI